MFIYAMTSANIYRTQNFCERKNNAKYFISKYVNVWRIHQWKNLYKCNPEYLCYVVFFFLLSFTHCDEKQCNKKKNNGKFPQNISIIIKLFWLLFLVLHKKQFQRKHQQQTHKNTK